MMRSLSLAAALLLLALSGVVHGLWTGRWGPSPDLAGAAARCQQVPQTLGDWEGRPLEINQTQLEVAEVVGHVARQYVNKHTGQRVSLILICGRPGPISVHTPDVCYAGAGYAPVGDMERAGVPAVADGPASEFLTLRFKKPGVAAEPLRIFWAWSDRGPWRAPENPRLSFARAPVLYKLYVVRALGSPDEPLDGDPCQDFLRVLVPELQKCLSSSS